MKRFSLFLITTFFLFQFSKAQNPLVKLWDHRYGGTGNEKLSVFHETLDRGFILGGTSSSEASGDKTQSAWDNTLDYWIVKTDMQGNKIWDKRFGGTRKDELTALQQTSDGGYILGGFSNSGISGDKTQANWDPNISIANPTNDYWIVKTDSLGNKQWDKRFGGIYDDRLTSLQQTDDGGFILGGFSGSDISGDKTEATRGSTDFWIVKTDAQGNKEWDKRFGGTNNEQFCSLCITADGGYLLGGYSWSSINGDKTQLNCGTGNYCDFWIIKINQAGVKQWDKRFGGDKNDELFDLKRTADGGYILGGYSWSGISGDKTQNVFGLPTVCDYWILKIDSLGNKQWDQDFGGTEREDEFGNILQTHDGGFMVAGTSYSQLSGNKSENNMGAEQTWLIKLDSSGSKQWDKTIFTAGHDEAGLVVQSVDGCYVIANYTNGNPGGYKTESNRDPSLLTYDYWIAKFRDTTALPFANYTTSNQSLCSGTCIDFVNLSYGYDSYHWLFPGANPSADTSVNPVNICYRTPGTYPVSMIASNSTTTDTVIHSNYITVYPSPSPFMIDVQHNALFVPPGFSGYQWYFQNQPISGATDYFCVVIQDGDYSVTVIDSNGCQGDAEITNVQVGIDDLQNNSIHMNLFPNPAKDILYVFLTPVTSVSPFQLVIRNVLGEIIFEEKIVEDRTTVLIKDFSPGVYFAEVQNDERKMIRKFVKQ
jgi:PKD repeat protein